jgi:hypothetical protein
MPFQPAPLVIKLEIQFLRNGQNIENVWHCFAPEGVTTAGLELVATTADEIVKANWLPEMPAGVVFTSTKTTDISVEGGAQFILPAGSGFSGGHSGAALPNEVSYAVRLRAATGGRHGAGRTFWPGLAVDQMATDNTLNAPDAAAILAAITALVDALAAVGHFVVVLSRFLNLLERLEAVPFGPVTPTAFDLTVDSQRRRKPGIGT